MDTSKQELSKMYGICYDVIIDDVYKGTIFKYFSKWLYKTIDGMEYTTKTKAELMEFVKID
jgi:hypothetical protein